MRRMRWGRLTDEGLTVLNKRVHSPTLCAVPTKPSPVQTRSLWYQPFIVPTNRVRCAINCTVTFQVARRHDRVVYEFDAESANRRTRLEGLHRLDDDFTDRIPLRWQFTIGMPVSVSRKCPPLNKAELIANGTIGFIVGFDRSGRSPDHTVHNVDGATVHRLHQSRI